MAPAELSLHASRNAIGWTVFRGNLEDVAVLGPDVEAASHAAVGATCFRVVDFVGLRSKRDPLMLNGQQLRRVMDSAIAIVVIADRAIKKVITEDAIKRFHLGG